MSSSVAVDATKEAGKASGKFGWYELMTSDTAAAAAFYTKVIGWTTKKVGEEPMPYSVFEVDGMGVAGLMDLPKDAGRVPAWIGYVHVPDVDAYAERVKAAGGKIVRPPTDVPQMLRFSVVTDPQGAPFVLFTSDPTMPANPARPEKMSPGTISWHELMAADLDSALAFYSELFGWEKGDGFDMGPMGLYQMFTADGEVAGGMMKKMPDMPSPFWNYYLMVDSCKAAVERVTAGGGKVLNGPHQVPGGSWIVQAIDPQGGFFCLNSMGE
jgi:predicted enzyme related to lactoylglutathione lyase